jgi:hypothetical protein
MIGSEFSSGLIRTTFAAVPHRRAVMAAKVVVLAAAPISDPSAITILTLIAVLRRHGDQADPTRRHGGRLSLKWSSDSG